MLAETNYDIRVLADRVRAFVERTNTRAKPEVRCLDLCSEIGELCKELLIATQYGAAEFKPTDKWRDEFGDVVFSLLCLAVDSNIDISDALMRALEKYQRRFLEKGSIG